MMQHLAISAWNLSQMHSRQTPVKSLAIIEHTLLFPNAERQQHGKHSCQYCITYNNLYTIFKFIWTSTEITPIGMLVKWQ